MASARVSEQSSHPRLFDDEIAVHLAGERGGATPNPSLPPYVALATRFVDDEVLMCVSKVATPIDKVVYR